MNRTPRRAVVVRVNPLFWEVTLANRTTRVTLTAQVGQYISEMNKAAKATTETATAAQKLKSQEQTFNQIGRGALAIGTLAAVGVGLAVSKFAEFDKAMSGVQAATHESTENMGKLRDAALEAGQETVFSASEAAQAIEELGKAGVSTSDVLEGGLSGALDLAAAGELAVADAAEIAASALTQFNLSGADVPHVADLLAAGAGKAQGSVTDMGAALNQSGLVAAQMGLSLEETVGSLAEFASAGLMGSDAGTSFRAMLLRLANPTDEAKAAMKELGISAYDAGGNFVGMESLAGQLQTRLGGLTQAERNQALALIFGQDAIRTSSILYDQGAAGVEKWTKAVDDAGYAADTAAQRQDNLAGDIEKLGGALDTALIKTGSAANDALRGLTQGITGVVDAFGAAPAGVQNTALAFGALTAAVTLAGGAFLIAVPKVAAFKAALSQMSPATQKAAGVLADLGKTAGVIASLGLAATVLDKIANGAPKAAVGIEKVIAALEKDDLQTAFSNGSSAADSFAESLDLVSSDSFDAAMERAGESLGAVFGIQGVVSEARKGFESLDAALSQLVSEGKTAEAREMFQQIADKAEKQGISIKKLKELFPEYTDALAGAKRGQKDAADASDDLEAGLEAVGGSAEDAQESIDQLADSLRNLGQTQLDLNDANRQVEQALDDFNTTLEENGRTLDITTEEGRANQAALDAIAESYGDLAAATVENTGNQEDAIPIIQQGRDALIKAGEAAGMSREEAEKYADSLGLIPKDVSTSINLDSAQAMREAQAFAQLLNNMPNSKTVALYIEEQRVQTGAPRGALGAAYERKDGGIIPGLSGGSPTWWRDGVVQGPGGPRDDRVKAMLSPGEFVVNADATSKNLAALNAINSGRGLASSASVDMGPVVRALGRVEQGLREVRDRTGSPLPVGAIQGSLGSQNVGNTRFGRGS